MNSGYTVEEIRSRLGISTTAVRPPLDRESLESIGEAGISHLEISEIRDQFQEEEPETMKKIVSICRDVGLSICSFHSPSIIGWSNDQCQWRKEIDRCKRIIDHLLLIGARIWGTHVRITEEKTKDSLYELAKYYEGQDIRLVIEGDDNRMQDAQASIEWIDSIGHPQIGLLLDVGHERDRNAPEHNPMTIPRQAGRIIKAIGHRLHHLHLHDVVEGQDHYAPFEPKGELQWGEIFSALNDIDYQGIFMFEPVMAIHGCARSSDPVSKVGRAPERIVKATSLYELSAPDVQSK